MSVAMVTKGTQMESDELKAHIETLRDAVDGLIAAIEFKKQMSDYPIDSIVALAKKVFDKTPAQSLNHIRAQAIEEYQKAIKVGLYFIDSNVLDIGDDLISKYKEQSDD